MKNINKESHIETGLQIKIILASCFDHTYIPFSKYIVPGSVHTIVDRPSRKSRKNGDMGVWIEGTNDEKVFIRFFGYVPIATSVQMTRTKRPEMIRTTQHTMQRTK